jgi:hypothetical protein
MQNATKCQKNRGEGLLYVKGGESGVLEFSSRDPSHQNNSFEF